MLRGNTNREFDFARLRELVRGMVHENSGASARELAQAMGKSYSTLCRETNPADAGAKLGLEDFLRLTILTGDFAPMRFIAAESGFLSPPERQECGTHEAMSGNALAMEMARRFFRLMDAWLRLQAEPESRSLRRSLQRDADDFLQFVLHWKHALESGEL